MGYGGWVLNVFVWGGGRGVQCKRDSLQILDSFRLASLYVEFLFSHNISFNNLTIFGFKKSLKM